MTYVKHAGVVVSHQSNFVVYFRRAQMHDETSSVNEYDHRALPHPGQLLQVTVIQMAQIVSTKATFAVRCGQKPLLFHKPTCRKPKSGISHKGSRINRRRCR